MRSSWKTYLTKNGRCNQRRHQSFRILPLGGMDGMKSSHSGRRSSPDETESRQHHACRSIARSGHLARWTEREGSRWSSRSRHPPSDSPPGQAWTEDYLRRKESVTDAYSGLRRRPFEAPETPDSGTKLRPWRGVCGPGRGGCSGPPEVAVHPPTRRPTGAARKGSTPPPERATAREQSDDVFVLPRAVSSRRHDEVSADISAPRR
jgi:hypothetical protein